MPNQKEVQDLQERINSQKKYSDSGPEIQATLLVAEAVTLVASRLNDLLDIYAESEGWVWDEEEDEE